MIHTAFDTPQLQPGLPTWRSIPAHPPCVMWFTGLSGAGKSTIAGRVKRALDELGCYTVHLDGDELRAGLCRDLGFSDADRMENVRRVAEVASLMVQARLMVLVTLISPFKASRDAARGMLTDADFMEIFVDASLDTVTRRDTKGLYAKAAGGAAIQLTGVQSPYERPEAPELRIDSAACTPDQACAEVLALLRSRRLIGSWPASGM